MADSSARHQRLQKHFKFIIEGKTPLTPQNSTLFIEAICSQLDAAACVDRLTASTKGLSSLQSAMRFDLTVSFFNDKATKVLQYLSSPEISGIGGGGALRTVIKVIVEPPIFWSAYSRSFQAGELNESSQRCFAWLLLQLIQFPGEEADPYKDLLSSTIILDTLLASEDHQVKSFGYEIKHIVNTRGVGVVAGTQFGPGGRHDNDFVDFREIAILPSADEILSDKPAFFRTSYAVEEIEEDLRLATHLDNQFRLSREDMLYEMRDDLHLAFGKKSGKYRGVSFKGLTLLSIYNESSGNKCKWALVFRCSHDFWQLRKVKNKERKQYFVDHRNVFKHQSLTCLRIDDRICAFLTVHRDIDRLATVPPEIVLQLESQNDVAGVLQKLATAKPESISLYQIDTAVFAYEPVLLTLQETQKLALSSEIMLWAEGAPVQQSPYIPDALVDSIRRDPTQDLKNLLHTSKSIRLDQDQGRSLVQGLSQSVSLIQGPPGTGKSFIGALLAKALHDYTEQTLLVVCYTNHALDQFLEDLLDIGIPSSSLVRLGGKSTPRTEPLSLFKLSSGSNRRFKPLSRDDWTSIDGYKKESDILSNDLNRVFQKLLLSRPRYEEYLDYLEFEEPEYYKAFQVPKSSDGMQQVGSKGKDVKPDFLIHRWCSGNNAGKFSNIPNVRATQDIWKMPQPHRHQVIDRWREALVQEYAEEFAMTARRYNTCLDELEAKFNQSNRALLQTKRIIGCTTTAAAKYREDLKVIQPGILLVEEAGEILESHILTALRAETRQLILIGDHKQLRPKVNNYLLTVEKGEGYDLNRSLFERLVLKGYPHVTLSAQHRMRPEIAALVKHLTYPELINSPSTLNRSSLRGVQNNIVFVNHGVPEDELDGVEERRDMMAKSSKCNTFEVEMVLKIVKYLGQQGYGTDKIVILTPYLGQLRELQKGLRETNDPVLSDLDSWDLVRAGLVTESSAKMDRKPIRLATIDNYQGEESDIVIISLTRSNERHEIGFMQAQERLTVLLSRARDALIMLGNAETFARARRGGEIWSKLFNLLKQSGQIYDGFPVQCERHPDRLALLKIPSDFDKECPDGGCLQPCASILKCGIHKCPSKCHQISDHSKMPCEVVMTTNCLGPKTHVQQWKCHKGPPLTCTKCERESKLAAKKQQEDFARQEKLDEEQRLHDQKLAEIDAEINSYRDQLRGAQLVGERQAALEQKMKDLELAKSQTLTAATSGSNSKPSKSAPESSQSLSKADSPTPNVQVSSTSVAATPATSGKSVLMTLTPSVARTEWQRQKTMEGAVNNAIDAIMEMTGLEKVKEQVLSIKAKVDTALRQGTSLKGERFNVAMLGNPGTGKTTVARHYAQFLASVQVIPGNTFVEKTGSGLANDGVPAVKKIIEGVINGGGGTIFVDEAYQLASPENFGGKQVLDFLLAEMENNVGKIAFIFAGYNREMEKFFEHNPGLTSRVPYQLQFTDYEDPELLHMLDGLIQKQWKGKMQVDDQDGIFGLFGRIVVRRLGRGRGREGFGNARALQNVFAKIRERQANRLTQQRRNGLQPDDFLLVKEDLIGPDPAQVMTQSSSWKKLQEMIGLQTVKDSVANLFDMIKRNYERELLEKNPVQVSLNRVFLGSPGTGKTTVAKRYGQILAELGLISNGEVVTKNPADFIGAVLGQSESQTKAILANTVGKVLIIDEAYSLYGGGKGSSDPYKTAVIDTIVAEVQSTPGEDRCVLLLGYKAQIEEMFQNVNPGLSRRFAIEDAFHFNDYSDSELLQALDMKLKDGDLSATAEAKVIAIDVLSRLRNRPNFGNIGEVENLLSRAKTRYQQRQALLPISERQPDAPFEPQDFDENFDRHEHATANLAKLFEGTVGCDELVAKLSNYQQMTARLKKQGKDPRALVPTNFVFKGPPGTGKTTTARKMGQVYYDMGFLSSTEVVECSASDLVDQYVGHTGPKTRQVFERALGRVLFIDEAYRLSEGHFAKEAMDELVGILTQEAFRGKLVVILAGYDQEMNELLAVNPGLSSRFPDEVSFHNFKPDDCLRILKNELEKNDIKASALYTTAAPEYAKMASVISALSSLSSWGNARDVITMAKKLITVAFGKPLDTAMELSADEVLGVMEEMLTQRQERSSNMPKSNSRYPYPPMQIDEPSPKAHRIETSRTIQTTPREPEPQEPTSDAPSTERDPGVSDDIWFQLQADKKAKEEREKREAEERAQREQELREAIKREQEQHELMKQLAEAAEKDAREREELMRQREQARLRALAEKEKRARIQAEIEARRKEEETRRKEEARVQAKIRQMGVCVAGFQWIKQAHGYRCAGGTHFLSNGQLGIN